MVVNKADIDQELEVPEQEQDDSSREAESNLSGEEADTESDSTALNSDASSVRSLFDSLQGSNTFRVSEEKETAD